MIGFNTRILVVDDDESIRRSIRRILEPAAAKDTSLADSAARLFGTPQATPVRSKRWIEFEVQEAANGRQALELVERSLQTGTPFSTVFLDMRMPGWDGLETARRLREADPLVEILFVTAQSDYDIDHVVQQTGAGVGYLCKPFANEEIRQLATKSVYDWNKLRNLERLIEVLGSLQVEDSNLNRLLANVFDQVVAWTGADGAALVSVGDAGECLFSYGTLDDPARREGLRADLGVVGREVVEKDGFLWLPLDDFGVLISGVHPAARGRESHYLLRLFLEHANQAIENARLHEELLRNERLSAIGSALSMVAHDLRSPIGGIQSAVEIAREESTDSEARSEMLDLIHSASDDALAIVEDVLDFTRDQPLEALDFEVSTLFTGLRLRLQHRPESRWLRFEGPETTQIHGAPSKLLRVLQNLCNNAMDAVVDAERADPRVEVVAESSDSVVRILVRDNGPGIPEAIRDRLFEPFATLGKVNGTGLGLAICKQIVESHGGRLRFESSAEGTEFCLEIPVPVASKV